MIDNRLNLSGGEYSLLPEAEPDIEINFADVRLTLVTKLQGNGCRPAWSADEILRIKLALGTSEVYSDPKVPDAVILLGRFEARQIARGVGTFAFSTTELVGIEHPDLPFSILDAITWEDEG